VVLERFLQRLAAVLLVCGGLGFAIAVDAAPAQDDAMLTVYLIDHQYVPEDELDAIRSEIELVFADQAGITVRWLFNESPRRELRPDELRVLVLASDGTRWFHGPSNVIGLAPHDDSGIGRNCFVFYRQALWFRQQAVLRCREATRARAQAEAAGTQADASIVDLAPAGCGEQLPYLTPMIVARAAAHEMVHILLNKLDHSPSGLMRDSFDITEWLSSDEAPFRLLPEEISALNQAFSDPAATAPGR